MAANEQEYMLGKDVTNVAQSKSSRDTVVVSVRLSKQDVAQLEKICHLTGKSMSQIVREAIQGFHVQTRKTGYSMMVSTSGGAVFALGDPMEGSLTKTWQIDEALQR